MPKKSTSPWLTFLTPFTVILVIAYLVIGLQAVDRLYPKTVNLTIDVTEAPSLEIVNNQSAIEGV